MFEVNMPGLHLETTQRIVHFLNGHMNAGFFKKKGKGVLSHGLPVLQGQFYKT
jgi:hypothetical protein